MAEKKNENKAKVEMCKIKLPKDRMNNTDKQYVGVNGVGMFVPRGVETEIPKPYYDVLMQSQDAQEAALDHADATSFKD